MPAQPIDMRSDTVTRPTPAMRAAIAAAEVGDDMIAEDPTVNRLERMCCEIFGKQAAVYACSGTQSNQMGVRVHCYPGDELLIETGGHIANFEAGAPAALSGVTCRLIEGQNGLLDLPQLEGKIRAVNQHLTRTRLVCLENTTNLGGGYFYTRENLARVSNWAWSNGLKMHLDGARLFNASVASGLTPAEICSHFDTISVCFSKGLGCPMGSVLVGNQDDITKARHIRKLFGGALRQAGMMAASAIHALEHHVERLSDDHENARLLADGIALIPGLSVETPVTNLVYLSVDPSLGNAGQFAMQLKSLGVLISASGRQRLRACTHLDVSKDQIPVVLDAMRAAVQSGFASLPTSPEYSGPYSRG